MGQWLSASRRAVVETSQDRLPSSAHHPSDVLLDVVTPLADKLTLQSGETLVFSTPAGNALEQAASFTTLILVSVDVKWRQTFAVNLIAYICTQYPVASTLEFFALQGGAFCQKEIAMIKDLLNKLGFLPIALPAARASISSQLRVQADSWQLPRSNAHSAVPLQVHLSIFADMSALSDGLDLMAPMLVDPAYHRAPNLRRLVMVSCPQHLQRGLDIIVPKLRATASAAESQ